MKSSLPLFTASSQPQVPKAEKQAARDLTPAATAGAQAMYLEVSSAAQLNYNTVAKWPSSDTRDKRGLAHSQEAPAGRVSSIECRGSDNKSIGGLGNPAWPLTTGLSPASVAWMPHLKMSSCRNSTSVLSSSKIFGDKL